MNKKTYSILLKSTMILMLLLLLSCNMIGIYSSELDHNIRYVLNSLNGLILLFGIAFLCYPKKGEININKASQIIELKRYKLVAGRKSTNSQLFASEQEAWNILRSQFQKVSFNYAILYVYEQEKLPIVNINTNILHESEKKNELSVVNYWKPICLGR